MAVEVMVPRLGWSMESGVFGQWLKQDGEAVAAGDPIFSVEGEKATEEVESEDEGILRIRPGVAEPGAELTVGTVIGWLLAEGEPVPEVAAEPAGQPTAAGAAPPSGPPPDAPPSAPAPAAAAGTAAPPGGGQRLDGRPASSPRARRVARELGVDWRHAAGSGKGGRIRERDVRALAGRPAAGGAPAVPAPVTDPLPDLSAWGPVEVAPLSAARLRTAARRSQACQTVPMVTQHATADVTRLQALRARYAPRAEAAGGTLTLTAMLTKVAASALKVFPQFNGSVDIAAGTLVRRGYRHVGIAVETAHGLTFPVIRDADRKNMLQLAAELDDLSARAQAGTLDPAETQGGCFSICDLGFLGLVGRGCGHFTPQVNPPEAAILGVSPSEREPALDGADGPVPRLPLSLTCDHRVIDWPDAVRFLGWIVEALEEPLLLSLEG